MPRVSAWFIRASLLYLAMGFTLGGYLLANEGLAFDPSPDRFLPAHIEILIVGWMFQLAMGVAYWILPRLSHGLPRGNKAAGWAALVLLNAGILIYSSQILVYGAWLPIAGRILELMGIVIFISMMWRRVRSSF
jgi:hypothetical protein